MKHTPTSRLTHRQRGASLIEVLIATVVLAIGLLGTAVLQVTSKRVNLEADGRTQAALIAQDLLERMRTNPRSLATYTDGGLGLELDGVTMPVASCAGACTGEQLANLDLYLIELALIGEAEQLAGNAAGGLNEPLLCIDGPDGGSGIYTVTIAWRGRGQLQSPAGIPCGLGSGLYDSNDAADADVHRRVLTVTTFIAEPT